MIVSSLVVETTPGKIRSAAKELSSIPGLRVHNYEGFKIVVTVEVSDSQASREMMDTIMRVDGVQAVNLVYTDSQGE